MNAKFSIGELVILQSKSMPQHNGEYTVENIINEGEQFTCRLTQRTFYNTGKGRGYILCTPFIEPDRGREIIWAESSLRKRQEPSELSYTELMQTLRSPIYEVN